MSQLHRITVDPNLCGGRPTIRGLRIRVKDVLDLRFAAVWPGIVEALSRGEALVELL